MSETTGVGKRIKGLLASLLILVLLVGIPVGLLIAGGTPWPHELPSWGDITNALTAPDDGSAFLEVLKVIGWLAWLSFAAMLVVEIIARLRGVRAPRIPGLGLQQRTAAGLVTAAALLFAVAAPMFTSGASAADGGGSPATSSMSQSLGGHVQPGADAGQQAPRDAAPHQTAAVRPATPAGGVDNTASDQGTTRDYVVQQGDSLYSIAEKTLGSGDRFAEIAELNYGVAQADGGALDDGHWLHAGWKLHVPVVKAAVRPAGPDVTVKTGDTLSEIAQRELGDAGRYQEIFDASKSLDQPGGAHLTDPDQIQPGWRLDVPAPPPPPAPHDQAGDQGGGDVHPGAPRGAQPGDGSGGGNAAGETGPGGPAAPIPDQPTPDQPAPDQPTPDQPAPDQPTPDQPAPDQPTPDQPAPDQPTPDQPVPDQPVPDQPHDGPDDGGGAQPDGPPGGAQESPDHDHGTHDNGAHDNGAHDTGAGDRQTSPDAAVRPAEGGHERAPDSGDGLSESGLPAMGVVVGAVLAVGLRRRRRGQTTSSAQQPGRPSADDGLVELVDRSLRSLAYACVEESRPLPVVRAARLAGRKLELYLDRPTELPSPWTGVPGGTVWSRTLADDATLTPWIASSIAPPYPSLVTLGHDHEGAAVLVDLDFVGALGVVGDRAVADGVIAAIAAELAVAPWSQSLGVTVLGGLADLAASAGAPLRHRATTVQARAELLSGEQQVLLVAGTPTRDQVADLAGVAEATPGVGLVAPSDEAVGRWALVLDPSGWALLQPLGLPIRPQSLSPEDYRGLGPEPSDDAAAEPPRDHRPIGSDAGDTETSLYR